MSDITKVVIAFAVLIVIGGSIIGYGIWRKVRIKGDQEAVLRQAHSICDTTAASFVQMDAEAREKLLDKAERLKRQIGDFDDLETVEAEALTTWIQEHRRVHGRFLLQENKLRGVLVTLQFTPPVEANEQLSPREVQTLRQAIASGNEIVGQLVPLPGGASLTMQASFPTRARDIGRRVGEVQAEIDNRERVYTTFVTRHSAALSSAKSGPMGEDDVKRNVDELQKWLAFVQKCPEKLDRLNQMKAGWDGIVASGKKAEVVRKRLNTAYTTLSTGPTGTALIAAIANGKAVLEEAKRLNAPSLQSDIIRLERVIRNVDSGNQQARKRETLVAKIIADNARLASTTSSYEKTKLEGDIQKGIGALKLVDLTYGRFFDKVLTGGQQDTGDVTARKAIVRDLGQLKTASTYRKVSLIAQIESNINKLRSSDRDLADLFGEVLIEWRKSSATPGVTPRAPSRRRPTSSSLSYLKTSMAGLMRANTNLKDASKKYFLYTGTSGRTSTTYARKLRDAVSTMDTETQSHYRRVSVLTGP